MQEETNARSAELPKDRRILFRIGVNIGDVVVEGEDLLGDGVNVAARLEGLAPASGIVLSGTAFDQVRDKLDVPIEEIGEVDVKKHISTGSRLSGPAKGRREGCEKSQHQQPDLCGGGHCAADRHCHCWVVGDAE